MADGIDKGSLYPENEGVSAEDRVPRTACSLGTVIKKVLESRFLEVFFL